MLNYFSCTLIFIFLSSNARADFFIHSWQDHHEESDTLSLDGQFNYYSTSSNYLFDGSTATPTGLTHYTRYQPDFDATWGLTSRLSLFGRLSWEDANVTSATSSSGFGLADQSLALNYRVLEREKKTPGSLKLAIDLQFQFDFPGYNNSGTTTSSYPYMGDSTYDFSFGGFATFPLVENPIAHAELIAGAGYTFRTNGFSAALPWSLTAEYFPNVSGLFGALGGFGFLSMKTDTSPVDQSSATRPSINTGGSFITYAVNPSLANFAATLGYQTSPRFMFYASAAIPVWGQSAPMGYTFAGGISFKIVADSKGKNPLDLAPSKYGKANRGFVEYSLDARIMRVNDRLALIKIDKGSDDGVDVGQVFDIFRTKPDGSVLEAVARATVSSVKGSEAALTVTEYFKEVWIDEGFVAKRVMQ